MADRLVLDADAAHQAAQRLRRAAEELAAVHQRLGLVLDDHAGCWGDDEIGKAFANQYVQIADSTHKNTGTLATNKRDTAKFTDSAVEAFVDTDAANAHRLDTENGELVDEWTP